MVTAAVQPQPQQNQGTVENQGPADVNEVANSSQQAEQQMETEQQQWKETRHVYKCTAVVVCMLSISAHLLIKSTVAGKLLAICNTNCNLTTHNQCIVFTISISHNKILSEIIQ